MKFDLFHSLGRIDYGPEQRSDRQVYADFFAQVDAADRLGFGTLWLAESHFSSELQKRGPAPVIPNYPGEVGLNADSLQLAQLVLARTKHLGFGTAILNIVGGNGGPIAAADRVNMLAWTNGLRPTPRSLAVGFAAGRFPYINKPFGIVPRSELEVSRWPEMQRLLFVEALTIFLRLLRGDTLSSADLDFRFADGTPYPQRWHFDSLKLIPEPELRPAADAAHLRLVLGSSDPLALAAAWPLADVDLFNLSFTPPAKIEQSHREMAALCSSSGRQWHRARLPRTVLVFMAETTEAATAQASRCLDVYIEAMRGTAVVPDKAVLMERALIGDAATVRAQLQPGARHGFHADDRLMLWFEFNCNSGAAVLQQMERFAGDVMPYFSA